MIHLPNFKIFFESYTNQDRIGTYRTMELNRYSKIKPNKWPVAFQQKFPASQ